MPARNPPGEPEFVEGADPDGPRPKDISLRVSEEAMERMRMFVKAAEMRARRMSFREIAQVQGWSSPKAAKTAVAHGLTLLPREDLREAHHLAELEGEEIARGLWGLVTDPGPLVSQGKVIYNEATGEPQPDKQIALGAYQALTKVWSEMRKFRGVDAPRRSVSAVVDVPLADIEKRLAELRGELGIEGDDPGGAPAALPGVALPVEG